MKINKKYYECEFIQTKPNKRYGNTSACWYTPHFGYHHSTKVCGKHSLELFEVLEEIQMNFARSRKYA